MKTIAVATLMILAIASALPQTSDLSQRRDIVEVINNYFENLRQKIRDGYDPLFVDKAEIGYTIPEIISARAYIENSLITGASNFVITDISHSLVTNKLTIDITSPVLQATGAAGVELSVLGRPTNQVVGSGRIAIRNLAIRAEVDVDLDSTSNVLIGDLVVAARLGGIEAEVYLNANGYDLSSYVNNFLTNTLPALLNSNLDRINKAVAETIMYFLDRIL